MNGTPPTDPWEARVREAARQFRYPPTPPIATRAREQILTRAARPSQRSVRRWAWALAVIVLVAGSLLAVPDVRAALRTWLRIGAITFVQPAPDATATPPPPPSTLLDLAGATTLEQARARVSFPIKLPTYPPNLGPPDQVYVQELGGSAAIFTWTDPQQPDRVALGLYQLTSDVIGQKFAGEQTMIRAATVNGAPAAWVHGPHVLQLTSGTMELRRLVDGNVLVWEQNGITYRLETDRSLDEAVRIAESLR